LNLQILGAGKVLGCSRVACAETSGLKRRLARLDATPSTVPEQEYRFLLGRFVDSATLARANALAICWGVHPHLAWIDPAIIKLHSIRSGSPRGFLRSEIALLVSLPLPFLPWVLIVLPLAFRFRRESETQAIAELATIRFALLTAGIATAIMALVIALVSLGAVRWLTATGFAIRYLYPFCLVATLGIAGLIARRVAPDGFARILALISVAASLVIFAVKLGSLLVVPASGDAVNLIPYTGLANALASRGLAEAQFVANSPRDAGNLAIYMTKARALALSARIEPPPPDPVLDRPCGLIWTDENHKFTAGQRLLALLGVTKEAHATKDVTVGWAAPLIGTQRQSVWHILRGETVEKACRRVAARGVL
jgi:hypothetical protein